MQLTIDEIEKDASGPTPDEIAARCTEYEFGGKRLHAFSKTRQTAARCMGNHLFLGRAKPDDNGIYDQLFMDAIIVIWLCSVDDARVRRACINGQAALDEALQWWDENGGDFGSERDAEAVTLFMSIVEDLTTVSAEIDSTPGSGSGGEALGE